MPSSGESRDFTCDQLPSAAGGRFYITPGAPSEGHATPRGTSLPSRSKRPGRRILEIENKGPGSLDSQRSKECSVREFKSVVALLVSRKRNPWCKRGMGWTLSPETGVHWQRVIIGGAKDGMARCPHWISVCIEAFYPGGGKREKN